MSYPVIDFPSLSSTVTDYFAGRTDLATRIQTFVALAESKFNRRIRNRQSENISTAVCTANVAYVPLPADYVQMRQLLLFDQNNDQINLQFKDPTQLNSIYANQFVAQPTYFTIVQNQIKLAPVPDYAYTLQIDYFARFVPLTSTTPTNWLITNHPDVYLYATMFETSVFLQDSDKISLYQELLSGVIEDLLVEENKELYDSTPLVPTADFPMY